MMKSSNIHFADPHKECQWEYLDLKGKVQNKVPSIALWTWAAKGLIPTDLKIRRENTEKWIALNEAASEIMETTRVQFSKLLFHDKEWFYIGNDDIIRGPVSETEMLIYTCSGYFLETNKLYGRPIKNEMEIPKKELFKFFGFLLDECMNSKKIEFEEWAKGGGSEVEVSQDISSQNGSYLNEIDEVKSAGERTTSSRQLNVKPQHTFEELKQYAPQLFSNASYVWYTTYEDKIYGPYKNEQMLNWFNNMNAEYKVCSVVINQPPPTPDMFKTIEACLLNIKLLQ